MNKPTKKQQRSEAILRHGLRLKRIFPATGAIGPIALCKTLHRIEVEAHRLAERQCDEQLPEGYVEKKEASIMKRLENLLEFSKAGVPVLLNDDPRGYALKISDDYVRANNIEIERDWGGYGIIAPEF